MPDKPDWFALTLKAQHEKAVAAQLQAKGIEGYVPFYRERHRWSDRIRTVEVPLFPRYAFARFRLAERVAALSLSGVTSIVSFGGQPCPVEPREIEAIQCMIASGLPVTPWPLLKIGQPVRLSGSAMDGLEGILVGEKTGYRVVVNVQLLNRAVSVEIDRSHVEAVTDDGGVGRCELHIR